MIRSLAIRTALVAGALTLLVGRDLGAQSAARAHRTAAPKVGPPRGAVMVVGGGAQGPEVFAKFIELAGGPDALIIDVPTAGGDSVYPAEWRGTRGLRVAGARNVVVLHTIDRKVAESDSFVAPIRKAGGIWFEGGRQWHLVDSYAGTKTEKEFHQVLARGGVVGGSSAGASILASFLLRGAREGNAVIMAPGYEAGFGFLRGVAIDQHVVARERLRDIADSLMPSHPELLGLSEDEGTAWVVRGDVAEIIGRNKAFAYGGKENDPGKPFLTLRPGDRYDLASRRVVHRAVEESPVSEPFVDSLFAGFAKPGSTGATVLVAQNGKVFIDKSYGIPDQPKYMPTTTAPNFPLGGLSDGYNSMAALILAHDEKLKLDDPLGEADGTGATVRQYLAHEREAADGARRLVELLGRSAGVSYAQLIARRIFTPIGAHKTVTGLDGQLQGNVDELYRWELGLENRRALVRDTMATSPAPADAPVPDETLGWRADTYRGTRRLAEYGTPSGGRNAFVRLPEHRAVVIILTNDDTADARGIAERITDRLLPEKRSSR